MGLTVSQVYLFDERSGQLLCRLYSQDKQSNARGVRRPLEPLASAVPDRAASAAEPHPAAATPPLLAKLIAQQSATGLPPAYLPKDEPSEAS
jgi:putative transposase